MSSLPTILLYNYHFLDIYFTISALLAASGIILSALSSHLPETILIPAHPPFHDGRYMLSKAANMALWQGATLCAIIAFSTILQPWPALISISFMIIGALTFCISLTLRSFGITCPARLTPMAGMILIIAWVVLAFSLPVFHKPHSKTNIEAYQIEHGK